MAGSTNKKVLVLRFDRETLQGFVNPGSWQQAEGIELLTANGNVSLVPYSEIKTVYFVRDFEQGEPRSELRVFHNRPKHEGLWVRLRLRGGEIMDGVLPNNLVQWESQGFSMIPPDPSLQNQRVYVPRAAVEEARILGVVGGAARRKGSARKPTAASGQLEMFGE